MPSRSGQQLSGSPFLYRTPQALQSVRGPSGPQRHCGVWWQPQLRQVVRLFFLPEGRQAARRHMAGVSQAAILWPTRVKHQAAATHGWAVGHQPGGG